MLTKLELGIEVGYVTVPLELERAYRLYQAQNAMNRDYKSKACTYAQDSWLDIVRNSQYKDNAKKISSRVNKIIQNIMEKEEELNAQGKIEKNDKGKDMLEAKTFTDPIKILDFGNFPKTEYKPEDAAYDRNQFIRSYFRYKDYKVENGLLTVKGKQINFENESLDVCKITLPIRPIIIFSKLYSFDEIVQKVFSSGIIRDKETKEILKIDFPLTSSVIEKVAKKYGIEYIMFSKSTIRYLFLKDLLYLDDNVPCLKFRNLTITHKVCCTLTDKSRNNIYQKQKLSFHPRLRQVIWHKSKTVIKDDAEIIKRIWESNASECARETVMEPKHLNSLSLNEKSDVILEFFEKLSSSDEVCVIYESQDDVPGQIGYAKYDITKKEVIINNCAIRIEKIISLQRIANFNSNK